MIKCILFYSCIQDTNATKTIICLTDREIKTNVVAENNEINAANLALIEHNERNISVKNYFYGIEPFDVVKTYQRMVAESCSAIVGYEYLSDLRIISKMQPDIHIPILSTYSSALSTELPPKNIFELVPYYDFMATQLIN